jgi:hypothetical protein
VHWSKTQLADAQKVINNRRLTLTAELKSLKQQGAVSIRVVKLAAPMNALVTKWPAFKAISSVYELRGISAKGKTVGTEPGLPTVGSALNDALIHLIQSNCSLSFATGIPKCSLSTPSPAAYLQATLTTLIYYSGSEFAVLDMLREGASSKLTYTISNGNLTCPDLAANFDGETSIPLQGKTPDASYKITVGPTSSDFTYTESSSAVALARILKLRLDSNRTPYIG